MWIIPNNYQPCSAFAPDTVESSEDLGLPGLNIESSLMWRSKHSQLQTWLRRWKRDSWLQRLSTRILRPSHTESFATEWTYYLEDSHVSLSVLLDSVKESKMNDTCFRTLQKESQSADLDLFSWRTSKELSQVKQQIELRFCSMSSDAWKSWVTKLRQEYSQRLKLAHPTSDEEYSSWPTIAAHEARLGYQCRDNGKKGTQKSLTTVVVEDGRRDAESNLKTGKSQNLNPNWVEQLMGLPVGWTDCGSWETE